MKSRETGSTKEATALLLELLRSGVQLWAEGEELRFRAARGAFTPALREELSRRKPEVMALLAQRRKYALPSFAQQRLWLLDRLEPGSPSYNIPLFVRLAGRLERAALERSLRELSRRHEVLRTTFASVEGQPLQVIDLEPGSWTLPVTDLQEPSKGEHASGAARRLAEAEARRPFDLARGPLWRARLLRLAPDEHVLLLTMHHVAFDGWSTGVLFRELGALYETYAEDLQGPSPLPELSVQYADFALWQRRWLEGEELERQLSYWRRQLGGDLPVLELATDKPRPPVQTFHGTRWSTVLYEPLATDLKESSRREGVTLFMMLLAAFQALLHRYAGQDDIVVGSPIAGRNRSELEGLIGFFVNTLVLRADLSGDPTFRELLGRVREVALGAYANQDAPFEKLIEELQPERDTSRAPLFQVMFALQNAPTSTPELPGMTAERLEIDNRTAKFDLTLSVKEEPEGLRATFEYNTDLFEEAAISRMSDHFRTLLEGAATDPKQRLSALPLLTEGERRQLLVEWNDTRTNYPQDKCVHELFEEQVERTPDAVAVASEDEQLTYRELNERANRLAHHLRKLGVEPETLVGICVERSAALVVGLLGILKAGGAYVPLDPAHPRERLSLTLEDARAPVLLTRRALLEHLPESGVKVIYLDDDSRAMERESARNPGGRGTGEDLAYVIYTSGSTGKPKGVLVPHRAINRLVMNADYAPLTSRDVVAQASNAAFDAVTWEVWGALLNGARLVVVPRETLLSPRALGEEIERSGINAMFLTTALFNQIARENPAACRPLKHLLFGGEAVEPGWVREVLEKGAPARLLHVYGPTETTTFATWHLVRGVEDAATTIPIGRPISNTEAHVLDGSRQPVPIGVPGELYVGGPGVARGYLNRPGLTEEKFVSSPFSDEPGARLYRTGDRVRRRANGDIEFLGRVDHQVKIRGFRVEPGEIEAALNAHQAVRACVVVLRGETSEQKRLVAYHVAPAGAPAPLPGELRSFLGQRLPDHMVPSAFVALEALPLNPNGKVDRSALPEPEKAGRFDPESTFADPRDELEGRLADLWGEFLDVAEVGLDDDFFELGGHSLLAVSMFARIEEDFGRRLPLATLFQAPTVRRLADVLRQDRGEEGLAPLVAVQPHGSRPPFFCVPGGAGGGVLRLRALAQRLGPDQPFYSCQTRDQVGETVSFVEVEEMAAGLVRELSELQPAGPYFLGGYSFGGVVAVEMARRLRERGESVALLALLDTGNPEKDRVPVGTRLRLHARRLRRLGVSYPWELVRRLGWTARYAAWSAARAASRRFGSPVPRILWHINFVGYEAFKSYKVRPYPGRITLFRSEDPWERAVGPDLGWGRVAEEGVEVHLVPGDHLTVVEEPHVEILAARLEACLDRARREAG